MPLRIFICLALLQLSFMPTAQAEEPQPPNILFISIDDQNDWLGCMGGHPQAKSPHIDELARRGTLFLNAHCQSPLCNPSRTSLMTSQRPSTTGIYGLAPWFREVEELKHLVSLPQALSNRGYTNYSTGKIYHGGYGRRPRDKEFEVLGPPQQVLVRPEKKLVDTPANHPLVDWGTFEHQDEDKGDFRVASWAIKTLEEKPQEPFCLSVGFFLPHVPLYATQKWFDMYPEDELQLPEVVANDRENTPRFSWNLHWQLPEPRLKFLKEADQWKNITRSYLACVSFVDSQVGRVLDALEEQGYADNTIVVLWSDHGFHLGEKEITGKNTLWRESTRVPLIFSGPGIVAGQRCEEPAELLDIYPTLLDMAGLPEQHGLEGISLRPQLENAESPRNRPAITTHNHDNHSVKTRDWRFIQYADGSQELYQTREDPREWKNLADDPAYAQRISKLAEQLPKVNRKPAPGSQHRILTFEEGKTIWEGKEILSSDPIPEI